jgi:hypothetical protein
MRSRETWRLAVFAASLGLNGFFVLHYVLHRLFDLSLLVAVFGVGAGILSRYPDRSERRRRSADEQRPPTAKEQDASGG